MKKILLLIFLCTVFGVTIIAQEKEKTNISMIESLKVAYITKQLNLNAEEAQKFWPLHNSYIDELKKARKENMNNELVFEEKALNIRKKYSVEFKKILNSDERVNSVFTADRNFNNMMRKELINRRMNNMNSDGKSRKIKYTN
ncbi:MAG: hypothetical protein K2X26_04165 [Chitinophagaceae bacterium]|jgi:hypothetical protein|nr:hypothetical protein [Chitinophagaceae bacterium]MCA6438403.1 hypothetical protein [Chitinophagaceae bacterium]MCA6448193.1 hypothetical protein [Chitinophagaceae bacterium]